MEEKQKKKDFEFIAQIVVIVVLVGFLMFFIGRGSVGNVGQTVTGLVSASEIIPTGVPAIYGNELKISYDDVSSTNPRSADATIAVLSNIDRSETLEGADLQRYINVLYNLHNGISCEFCCGARSVIREDGNAACGCAHSYAMRGLAKYLIKFHGDEFTDEEILEEVGKWKVLFFPGIHEEKAQVLAEQGIELNYVNLASNLYRGIEKGQTSGSSGMVGGC
ncbi:MAG: hypothetical protein QQN41_08775 [Nitrosopumilus sp.]